MRPCNNLFRATLITACLSLSTTLSTPLHAEPSAATDSVTVQPLLVGHGSKGFELHTPDDNFLLQIQARGQFRYANPADGYPRSIAEAQSPARNDFRANRVRLKVGGHAYRPWLKYYYEYELSNGNLLDFRVMIERDERINFKVGQWKVQYNRERAISSGKQQMSERSIINRPFTLDRQQGASVYGRLRRGGAADFNYWASVFSGTGQQMKGNDDAHPMWMLRTQWNPFGRLVPLQGSDIGYHEKPAALLSIAGASNRSAYTRFSQGGGGQLPGFAPGVPGQYRVNQGVQETAVMYRGFGWQQEYHRKEINDLVGGTTTTMTGYFVQLGYMLHHAWSAVPSEVELAARYANWDPNINVSHDEQQEWSVALNCFFNQHLNKLTAEVTHITIDEPIDVSEDWTRFRLQWDVSL